MSRYVTLTVGSVTRKSSLKRTPHPIWDDVFVFKAQDDRMLEGRERGERGEED